MDIQGEKEIQRGRGGGTEREWGKRGAEREWGGGDGEKERERKMG